MNLEHVLFGDRLQPADAYGKHAPGPTDDVSLLRGTYIQASVLTAVQDDLVNRTVRGNRSQDRLSFPLETNGDDLSDTVAFSSGGDKIALPMIAVECQIP